PYTWRISLRRLVVRDRNSRSCSPWRGSRDERLATSLREPYDSRGWLRVDYLDRARRERSSRAWSTLDTRRRMRAPCSVTCGCWRDSFHSSQGLRGDGQPSSHALLRDYCRASSASRAHCAAGGACLFGSETDPGLTTFQKDVKGWVCRP